MLKRGALLALTGLLISSCTLRGAQEPPPVAALPRHCITQDRHVASFTQVDVQGPLDISLHTGYKKPRVILKGDFRDLEQVKVVVTGSTLYLILGNGYPRYGSVHADIQGRFLNRLNYKGMGTITGNNLHTSFLELYLANQGKTQLGGTIGLQVLEVTGGGLTQITGVTSRALRVRIKGNPKIQLNGYVSLGRLDIDGDAWLSLYWIKSNNLVIRARKAAKIQLAGIVNRLDVELWGTAQFKGRYLRALRSFVKTHNQSAAEIASVNHQSALATDASDIYYYNIPHTRADFMAFDGSVLKMREWDFYDRQDFVRYNKQFP